MLSQGNFNGQRLKEARLYRGLSLEELRKVVGVSKQMISKYEQGLNIPNPEILFSLVQALKFPREFFYTSNKQNYSYGNSYFRSLLSTPKKDKLYQLSRVENIVSFRNFLEQTIEFPKLSFPDLTCEADLERKAMMLREAWNLGDSPIKNSVELLESKGFVLSDLSFSNDKIDAFSQRVTVELAENRMNYYVIVLGSNKKSFYRRQFDAIHELAHILLHESNIDNIEDETSDQYKKIEREADNFAGYFLLPRSSFGAEVKKAPLNLNYYRQLKTKYHVSIAAMIVRTKQLEIIDQDEYTRLFKGLSRKDWRKQEPLDSITPVAEPEAFKEAMDLIFEEGIYNAGSFLSDFSNYTGKYLSYSEIEELLALEKGFFSQYMLSNSKLVSLKRNK